MTNNPDSETFTFRRCPICRAAPLTFTGSENPLTVTVMHGTGEAMRVFTIEGIIANPAVTNEWLKAVHEYERGR